MFGAHEIQGNSRAHAWPFVLPGPLSVRFDNNDIHGGSLNGILITGGGAGAVLEDNTLHGQRAECITLAGGSTAQIVRNTIQVSVVGLGRRSCRGARAVQTLGQTCH